MSEPQRNGLNPFAMPSGALSGDTFPIFRDGVCHLFHIMMPVIAHHVSRDLVHWEPRPNAIAPGMAGEPDCHGNATGCVVEYAGKFYLFYTGNQNICLATSTDLVNWTKHPGNPVLQGDDKLYERANFRDAYIFFNEAEKLWWMLFGSRTMEQPGQRAGCVGLAKSRDLIHWTAHPPLWAPHIGPHTDCPQLVKHGGQWFLFYLQRNTRYLVADSAAGPFRRPPTRNLTTPLAAAGSRPAFDGRRWISFPFVMRLQGGTDGGDIEYGGPLAVPRQLDFHADGTVTERPVDEMITALHTLPDPGDALASAEGVAGRWDLRTTRRAASLDEAGGTLFLPVLPADFYLEFDLVMATTDSDFHLLLRATRDLMHGYQLALHPRTAQVSLRPISIWDADRALISRSVTITTGRPFKLRVFLAGSILEVFLGDRASLTSRLYGWREGLVGLEFRDGVGAVERLMWRELATGDAMGR